MVDTVFLSNVKVWQAQVDLFCLNELLQHFTALFVAKLWGLCCVQCLSRDDTYNEQWLSSHSFPVSPKVGDTVYALWPVFT